MKELIEFSCSECKHVWYEKCYPAMGSVKCSYCGNPRTAIPLFTKNVTMKVKVIKK